MKNTNLIIALIALSFLSKAQTKEIKYYKDEYFSKKTSAEKGKFQLTTLHYADGSVETIKQKINSDRIIEHFKNDEPIGIWSGGEKELNFDFKLEYTETGCIDTLVGINSSELFTDNDSLRYIAPKIASGKKDLYTYMWEEVKFPSKALNEGLSGKSYISFEINEEGIIQNIQAKSGGKIFFDKEVIRMIRKLKISSPPLLNNKPTKICVNLPFKFVIH
jgi:TonB family protein